MDIENRPIEGATIVDESSPSFSTSYKNGSYKLPIEEGKYYYYYFICIYYIISKKCDSLTIR